MKSSSKTITSTLFMTSASALALWMPAVQASDFQMLQKSQAVAPATAAVPTEAVALSDDDGAVPEVKAAAPQLGAAPTAEGAKEKASEMATKVAIPEGQSSLKPAAEANQPKVIQASAPSISLEQKDTAPVMNKALESQQRIDAVMAQYSDRLDATTAASMKKSLYESFGLPLPQEKKMTAVEPATVVAAAPQAKEIQGRIEQINAQLANPKLPWSEFEKLMTERKSLEATVADSNQR